MAHTPIDPSSDDPFDLLLPFESSISQDEAEASDCLIRLPVPPAPPAERPADD